MHIRKSILSIVTAAVLLLCVGCPGEEGWRDGINNGIEEAVSSAISAPIAAWLESAFQ